MAVKKPIVGQLAYRGNVRRALRKFIEATSSMLDWQGQHPDWPTQLWTARQRQTLLGFISSAQASRVQRVPPPPAT